MTTTIDGVIKEWGDRFSWGINKGRSRRNLTGGKLNSKESPNIKSQGRDRLFATIRKAPEVMVKISGNGKNMGQIKAHMDYISRNGNVDLEDDRGEIYKGRDELVELRDNWRDEGYRIVARGGTKRESFKYSSLDASRH